MMKFLYLFIFLFIFLCIYLFVLIAWWFYFQLNNCCISECLTSTISIDSLQKAQTQDRFE